MKSMMFVVCLLAIVPASVAANAGSDHAAGKDAAADGKAAGGKSSYAYLGLRFRWGNSPAEERFLHVDSIAPGGPAHRAGLQPDDVITHVNDLPVGFGDELDFLMFMRERHPGERLVLTVVRTGKSRQIVVTLDRLPEHAVQAWKDGFRNAQQKRAAKARARKTDG